jgi:hypothetical protein
MGCEQGVKNDVSPRTHAVGYQPHLLVQAVDWYHHSLYSAHALPLNNRLSLTIVTLESMTPILEVVNSITDPAGLAK